MYHERNADLLAARPAEAQLPSTAHRSVGGTHKRAALFLLAAPARNAHRARQLRRFGTALEGRTTRRIGGAGVSHSLMRHVP